MRKLITICAVAAMILAVSSPVQASLQWATEWDQSEEGYVAPGIVTYEDIGGSPLYGHPTPHANPDDYTDEPVPPVKTTFDRGSEYIFAGVSLDLQAITLPDKDAQGDWIADTGDDGNGDGNFNIGSFNWFAPSDDPTDASTASLQDGGESVTWDTIEGWQNSGYDTLALYGPGDYNTNSEGLQGMNLGTLELGTWTVEVGAEDDTLMSTTTFEVVPEPATIALLGLGSLTLIRRKRRA